MRSWIPVTAAILAAFSTAATQAADQPLATDANASYGGGRAAAPGGKQPDVTISGHRAELEPRITSFVNQVTAFNINDPEQGMARWSETSACPLVTGLTKDDAEFLLGRISEIARAAKVPLGKEDCRPNLYILITSEPKAVLRGMVQRNSPFTFGDAVPRVIDEFIDTPRPVRVWYHTTERSPEGTPLANYSFPELQHPGDLEPLDPAKVGAAADTGVMSGSSTGVTQGTSTNSRGGSTALSNQHAQASRLRLNAVWMIYRVFVVVDESRLKGVTRGQLADYLGMVGLAQVKPGARLGDAPTILRLFEGTPEQASPGMTSWDEVFLKAFYTTPQQAKLQRNFIAKDMVHAVPR
jgi:hypothetical protein